MKKKVFISFSHEDKKYAERLAKQLSKLEISAWTPSGISEGSSTIKAIQKSLDESSHVIVLISDDWERSKWAAFELGAAMGKGKNIIPILMAGHHGDIPSPIQQFHYLDATKKSEEEIIKQIEKELEETKS